MNGRSAAARGGFVAAACAACCAPPIIAALGVTVGLAAVAGVFLGLAAAVTVVLVGAGWIVARRRHSRPGPSEPTGPVPVVLDAPRRAEP